MTLRHFSYRTSTAALIALGALLTLSQFVQTARAARPWILPSQTVLGPASPWVSFEAATSNNLFNANRRPIPVESIVATGPDGQPRELVNPLNGQLRSAFELELKTPGTYKIEQVPTPPNSGTASGTALAPSPTLFGSYQGTDGQTLRWRGTAEDLLAQGTADKPGLTLREFGRRRVVTFVTLGEPSDTVLAPEGTALEISYERTHPNDLYADEPATLRVLFDGQPLPDAKVTVVPEGDRYRDEEASLHLYTDSEGWVTIDWPAAAGRYLVETEARIEGTLHGVPSTKSYGYTVVLEVL